MVKKLKDQNQDELNHKNRLRRLCLREKELITSYNKIQKHIKSSSNLMHKIDKYGKLKADKLEQNKQRNRREFFPFLWHNWEDAE